MIHISSLSNTTFIAGMKKMLEEHGFEDVHIEAVPTPQYLIDYEPQYYRVATKQGVFGMMMGEYLLVDLTGTGIPLSEFMPEEDVEDVADLPPNFPPCIEFEDSEQFLLLWQLLTKKKARP